MNKFKKILIIIVIIILIIVFQYNLRFNDKFLVTSAIEFLSFIVISIITYFFIERKKDERRLKDKVEYLLMQVKSMFDDKAAYSLEELSSEEINSRNRYISNKINLLYNIENDLNISKELEYIKSNFDDYEKVIGDCIDNKECLKQIKKLLQSKSQLIEHKCDEAIMKLYGVFKSK